MSTETPVKPLTELSFKGGARSDLSSDETPQAHQRRWAYLRERGWHVTEEGIVLDNPDHRWAKTGRILIEYAEGVPFEEGVRAAWRKQKEIEALEVQREAQEPRKA